MRSGKRGQRVGGIGFGGPGAVAQHFGVLGNDHGQLVAGIGSLEALGEIPGVEVAVDLGHLVRVGILPAQLDGGAAPSVLGRKITA